MGGAGLRLYVTCLQDTRVDKAGQDRIEAVETNATPFCVCYLGMTEQSQCSLTIDEEDWYAWEDKKSQISIAEMVMQHHMPDGSTNTIRVGIEMPVEIPMKVSANVELPATEWSCTAYCDDQGKMSRIRMTHVDSFSALSAAYNAALLFIKGFSVIYGKELSYLDQSNLFISTSTFAMENSEVNTVVEKTDSDTRTPPSSPST